MNKIVFATSSILCLVFLFSLPLQADQRGRGQYDSALSYIKKKQYDFALMKFRSITRDFPESRYAMDSLFAMGEYFYEQGNNYEASKYFSEYINLYPESDGTVFIRAYLLKIMEDHKEIAEKLKMEFFSEPLFLLFSEYKELSYKSAFQNKFSIRYYIDMIEVYRNDEFFIKITK